MGFRVQLIAVTGKAPSAIQRLVGARCKQASMRNWTRCGAEGMLRLRAALQTGAYHNVWTHPKETAA